MSKTQGSETKEETFDEFRARLRKKAEEFDRGMDRMVRAMMKRREAQLEKERRERKERFRRFLKNLIRMCLLPFPKNSSPAF